MLGRRIQRLAPPSRARNLPMNKNTVLLAVAAFSLAVLGTARAEDNAAAVVRQRGNPVAGTGKNSRFFFIVFRFNGF